MLRAPDASPSTEPTPGLAQLPILLSEFERAGLHTTARLDDDITPPPATDLVAYRVIQEGLTNALKHGAEMRAHLLLTQDATDIHIVITNRVDQPPHTSAGSGNGLLGIRERVSALRGDVSTETHGDTFRLAVDIPVARPEAERL